MPTKAGTRAEKAPTQNQAYTISTGILMSKSKFTTLLEHITKAFQSNNTNPTQQGQPSGSKTWHST